MQVKLYTTPAETAEAVARAIADYINAHPNALLCLAAGDTPLPVFHELVRMQHAGEVDLGSVYYVGLDEWLGLGYETRGSCMQVMTDEFYAPAGIPSERMRVWDGKCADVDAERREIEDWIAARGGIGLTLLGVGMNGHIGFNEPFTGLKDGTILVPLDDVTKLVSVKYFDTALPVEYGLGVGAGTLKRADTVILMATGGKKSAVAAKILRGADEAVPASLLSDHPNAAFYLDAEAAREIAV